MGQRDRKPAAATWATHSDQQQGFFYMHHPTDRILNTTAFVTPVVEHWLERELVQRDTCTVPLGPDIVIPTLLLPVAIVQQMIKLRSIHFEFLIN